MRSRTRLRKPRIVVGGGGGIGTADVSWTIPEDSAATSQIGTHIWKSTDGVSWVLAATIANTSTTSTTVTSLASGTWQFAATSYNAQGDSDYSFIGSKVIP